MATNPIPPGTKNLSVNIPDALHADLKRLALDSGITVSKYVRKILILARDNNFNLARSDAVVEQEVLKAAEAAGAYHTGRKSKS